MILVKKNNTTDNVQNFTSQKQQQPQIQQQNQSYQPRIFNLDDKDDDSDELPIGVQNIINQVQDEIRIEKKYGKKINHEKEESEEEEESSVYKSTSEDEMDSEEKELRKQRKKKKKGFFGIF